MTTNVGATGNKADHFIAIADFYLRLCRIEKPTKFVVEPKIDKKGSVEPDVFMHWRKKAYLVEIQRTRIPQKIWKEKLSNYEKFKWSRDDKKTFPAIWLIGQKVEYDGTELEVKNNWGDDME